MSLIRFTDKGLYCQQGDFYIDPWRPVHKAIITHAHSDHARPGSDAYLCHHASKPLLQLRLGIENNIQSLEWNEEIQINGVKLSLHPAGHIIGSSQIRLEYKGEIWVASGDYKIENDGISGAFEPIRCHAFITESTFGLPIYQWKQQAEIYDDISRWIISNQQKNKVSVLIAYSLGKAQRVLGPVTNVTEKIFAHGAVYNVHQVLLKHGWKLPAVERVIPEHTKDIFKDAVVIAPPSADGTAWMKKFGSYAVGVCSGWMQVRGNFRRRNADAGFALSDHADWNGLISAVKATGAETVYVTHGFQSVFSRYLNEQHIQSFEVKTEYSASGEVEEAVDVTQPVEATDNSMDIINE